MPSEELFNDNRELDFTGTRGKIKSIEATASGMTISMRKRTGEVKYLISDNLDNYQSMASVAMLAYTLGETLSLQLSDRTGAVEGAGIGRLAVREWSPGTSQQNQQKKRRRRRS